MPQVVERNVVVRLTKASERVYTDGETVYLYGLPDSEDDTSTAPADELIETAECVIKHGEAVSEHKSKYDSYLVSGELQVVKYGKLDSDSSNIILSAKDEHYSQNTNLQELKDAVEMANE